MSMMDPVTSTGMIVLHDSEIDESSMSRERDPKAKRAALMVMYALLVLVLFPITFPTMLVLVVVGAYAIWQDRRQLYTIQPKGMAS